MAAPDCSKDLPFVYNLFLEIEKETKSINYLIYINNFIKKEKVKIFFIVIFITKIILILSSLKDIIYIYYNKIIFQVYKK